MTLMKKCMSFRYVAISFRDFVVSWYTNRRRRAVLTDFSQAFDCLNNELLIAKSNAYGSNRSALLLSHSYLADRQQRVKVNEFITSTETVRGVPQGSVLTELLLFNIYPNGIFMFLEETDICNYADDPTIYACGLNIENVIMQLENDALKIIEWFAGNFMKLNENKCHLLNFGAKGNNEVSIRIGDACVKESTEKNVFGITIDRSLSFEQHFKALCKKAG